MGRRHDHGASVGRAAERSRLRWVLVVTVLVLVAELLGAWVSGSLALLADAGHMLTDAAAVTVALSASYAASLPASTRRTFGLHRAEILAAMVNAVALLAVCGYLAYEGVRRLIDPVDVDALPMLAFGLVGLAGNLVSVLLMRPVATDGSLNLRAAYLEVVSDLLGSVLVVLAAVVVLGTGAVRADALASLVIAAAILPRSFTLLRESVEVLLEAVPAHVDTAEVRRHLEEVDGVVEVHDLHAWTITSGLHSLSVHVVVTDEVLDRRGVGALLDDLSSCVADCFAVEHTTFQVEPLSHREHEHLGEAHA